MSIWIGSFCMLSPVSKHSLLGGTHLLDISKLILLILFTRGGPRASSSGGGGGGGWSSRLSTVNCLRVSM